MQLLFPSQCRAAWAGAFLAKLSKILKWDDVCHESFLTKRRKRHRGGIRNFFWDICNTCTSWCCCWMGDIPAVHRRNLSPSHNSLSGCHGVISQTRTYPRRIGPSLRWQLAVGAGGFRWPHSRFTGIIHLCCCPGWDEEGSGSSRTARSWRGTDFPSALPAFLPWAQLVLLCWAMVAQRSEELPSPG